MAKRMKQAALDGSVKPLFATEAELQGLKEEQLPMAIGSGERPLEELPMFAPDQEEAADDSG